MSKHADIDKVVMAKAQRVALPRAKGSTPFVAEFGKKAANAARLRVQHLEMEIAMMRGDFPETDCPLHAFRFLSNEKVSHLYYEEPPPSDRMIVSVGPRFAEAPAAKQSFDNLVRFVVSDWLVNELRNGWVESPIGPRCGSATTTASQIKASAIGPSRDHDAKPVKSNNLRGRFEQLQQELARLRGDPFSESDKHLIEFTISYHQTFGRTIIEGASSFPAGRAAQGRLRDRLRTSTERWVRHQKNELPDDESAQGDI